MNRSSPVPHGGRADQEPPAPREGRSGAVRHLDLALLDRRVRVETEDYFFLERLARCYEETPGTTGRGTQGAIDLRVTVVKADAGSHPGAHSWVIDTDPPGLLARHCSGTVSWPTALVSALNLWVVESASGHYIFHAGAVARGGRAILLPAGTFGGKSTLTAGLVRRGFALLSDEIGALAIPSGRLVGYPRRMSIRSDVLDILGLPAAVDDMSGDDARMVPVEDLGGVRAFDASAPGMIVFPQFDRTRGMMERLRPGLAVVGLMEASCSQPRFKAAGLDLVIDLALRLPCYRLTYSDLATALDQVERAFADSIGGDA